ncbi:MAG: beta-lactamase family protein [Meiothermus sp.]|uniref:serine hydrolase domain-containing protein n=1 Tax=Meiothermus sp. TaxID=1955249 RepID=UPI0025F01C16|nr:serine hydrolase domain-containing protein [Meiothermus sp.]MCS7067487.1 beta-lactamase family protein [Meiothermus sp.]
MRKESGPFGMNELRRSLRTLLGLFSLTGWALAQTLCIPPAPSGTPSRPLTGYSAAGLEAYDRVMQRLLERYRIPGAALAVAKDGRLVLSRGYGFADVRTQEPVQPDALFRLASLSKPITAAAVLHLGESLVFQGVYPDLNSFLSEKAFDLLKIQPYGGKLTDPRLKNITLRDLLQHSGGWHRGWAGDPMFRPTLSDVARALHRPEHLSSREIVGYMLSRRLQFAPGSRSAYSNLGYAVLGLVVEKLSGQPYEAYVRAMLQPAGIYSVRAGKTRLQERLPREVRYHDFPGAPLVKSVLDGTLVNRPYGEFYLEAHTANGGLVASAPDLVRFVVALEGLRGPPLLSREALHEMLRRPRLAQYQKTPRYYALGWGVRVPQPQPAVPPLAGAAGQGSSEPRNPAVKPPLVLSLPPEQLEWSHDGAFAGSRTLLLRLPGGVVLAALFNSRPWNDWRFIAELRQGLENATQAVPHWPDYDCF